MFEDLYQTALEQRGEAFLTAEQQFAAQGEAATQFLQAQLTVARGAPALVTRALLQRAQRDPDAEDVRAFFDQIEQQTARSVRGGPPPEYVAAVLAKQYGGRVAALMGTYLIKLAEDWPGWKTVGVLLYLNQQHDAVSDSADALIAFIPQTASDHYRALATNALVETGDTTVLAQLEATIAEAETPPRGLELAAERLRNKLS